MTIVESEKFIRPTIIEQTNTIPGPEYAQLLRTFSLFLDIGLSKKTGASDYLLLLTTCRNEWYWLNALYGELRLWLYPSDSRVSFQNAVSALSGYRNPDSNIKKILIRAQTRIARSAGFLTQYKTKQVLYKNNFDIKAAELKEHVKNSFGRTEAKYLEIAYMSKRPQTDNSSFSHERTKQGEEWEAELDLVYEAAKALTGYFRTVLSNKFSIGTKWHKPVNEYYRELRRSFAFLVCDIYDPSGYLIDNAPFTCKSEKETKALVGEFYQFTIAAYRELATYVRVKFPGTSDNIVGQDKELLFLTPRGQSVTLTLSDRSTYTTRPDMYILLFDLNGSASPGSEPIIPKESISQFLKHVEAARIGSTPSNLEIITRFSWDDMRIVAFQSAEEAIYFAVKLTHWFHSNKNVQVQGVSGIKFGLTKGTVLAGVPSWERNIKPERVIGDHPILGNTIARAARLSNLFKTMDDELLESLEIKYDYTLFMDRDCREECSHYMDLAKGPISVILKSFGMRDVYFLSANSAETHAKAMESFLSSTTKCNSS